MRRLMLCGLLLGAPAWAATGENSFTPISYMMPVLSIDLSGPSTHATLYQCPDAVTNSDGGFVDNCMVDMADDTALAALFNSVVDVDPGHYTSLTVSQCQNGGFQVKVKGVVTLSGATYYTAANATGLSTSASDLDYVTINVGSCGGVPTLAGAFDLAAGDSLDINAFFTLDKVSWVLDNLSPGLGGCFGISGQKGVCTGLPQLITYSGDVVPTLDTYYITEDLADNAAAKAGGQVLIFRDTMGKAFGGITRRLYSETSVEPSGNYDTPIQTFADNGIGDGGVETYSIQTYGGGGPGGVGSVPYYLWFPSFELMTHTGTFMTTRVNPPASVPYLAVKQ
jgi:hypothetical protein